MHIGRFLSLCLSSGGGVVIGCWFSVVGYRLLVVGCRLSVVGYRLLVVGCRLSVFGCRLSVVGCWLLVIGCWLLVFGCSLTTNNLFNYYSPNSLLAGSTIWLSLLC